MNSGLNGTTRNIACQAAKKAATVSPPKSALRWRVAKLERGGASAAEVSKVMG